MRAVLPALPALTLTLPAAAPGKCSGRVFDVGLPAVG
eukprot:gene7782-16755_t